MKKLYLVRHAKSSWEDDSLSDSQRPLNKRGQKNVLEMGRRLAASGLKPDLIIASPAVRALTTARQLASAIGYDQAAIVQNRQLYFEGKSAMLKLIQQTAPGVKSLMLVGHNPDMTSLLNSLCGFQVVNMPTCAIASIQFKQDWAEVSYERGFLFDYDFPKNTRHL